MSKIIHHTGNYRNWNVYRKSVIVCDLTDVFLSRFMSGYGRTIDQMRQAARSCKQNIVEGSCAAATSRETEIKLTGVAKASLQELAEDYRDYLRQHNLETWGLNDPRTTRTRQYLKAHDDPAEVVECCRHSSEMVIANIMLTLIAQLDYMLRAVIDRAEAKFIAEGGIRERMTATRRQHRHQTKGY